VDPDDDNPEPVDNTSVVGPNVMVSPAAGEETSGEGSGLNDDVSEEDAEESGTAEEDAAEADSEDAPRPRKRAAKRAPARRR
jgi:hypothetical protein